jgi:hypothetical protein
MVSFEHTGYDNSRTTITGFYGVDTIWANSSVQSIISGESYNFLEAQVFPVCVYYKNGNVWGNSSAGYDEIISYSRPFYIAHFAMNSSSGSYDYSEENDNSYNEGWVSSSPNIEIDVLPDNGFTMEDITFEFPESNTTERDLDGIVDYLQD